MTARTIPTQFYLPSKEFTPAYFALGLTELRQRADEALEILRDCVACPRDCHVNRLEDKFAVCKTGRHAIVGSFFAHFGEEDCLRGWRGSGTIFFSMCNLRCAFCFRAGTPILTDRGVLKIEEIFARGNDEVTLGEGHTRTVSGLRVYTREGKLAPVVKAFSHRYEGRLIALKPYGLPELKLTPDHSVFAATEPGGEVEMIRAGDLKKSHYLVIPKLRYSNVPISSLEVRPLLEPHVGRYKRSNYRRVSLDKLRQLAAVGAYGEPNSRQMAEMFGYHPAYMRGLLSRFRRGLLGAQEETIRNDLLEEDGRLRFKTEKGLGIPSRLPLDTTLANLLGYFCAEGHVRTDPTRPNSHRLIFSFGHHENRLVQRTRKLIKTAFGIRATVLKRRTTVTVEVGSASIALLFAHLCGKGARSKRVPFVLYSAPPNVTRAFLQAYFEGDGSWSKGYIAACTVSEELAFGAMLLLLRIGILPVLYSRVARARGVIEGRRVNCAKTQYTVGCRREAWEGKPAVRGVRFRETENAFWVPIRRVSRLRHQGPVYNLEVADEDHSYLAGAVAVGNCQNYDISQQGNGRIVTPEQLASMMLHLQDQGCHNINFVTPEHVVPQILEALPIAVERGLRLPIVYNTSSYDSLHSMRLMDGIVDIYMPDFKYWDREMARHYMKAPDYPEVARGIIKEMHRQVGPLKLDELGLAKRGLIIRHLVMPGGTAGTHEIMRWIATELGADTYVNVMAQYYPAGQVGVNPKYEAINRKLLPSEFEKAMQAARDAGLTRLDARIPRSPWLRWDPLTAEMPSV